MLRFDKTLSQISPRDVGNYLETLNYAAATKKFHSLAIRHFFDTLVKVECVSTFDLNFRLTVRRVRRNYVQSADPFVRDSAVRFFLLQRNRIPAMRLTLFLSCWLVLLSPCLRAEDRTADSNCLPGTDVLTDVEDVYRGWTTFLQREIDASVSRRQERWQRVFSSADAYIASIAPHRVRLAEMIGVRDERLPYESPELVATLQRPALVASSVTYDIFAVRWPVLEDVYAEGLLLSPTSRKPVADVVALPDADHIPEQLVGLKDGIPPESQYARRLAESGCRVLVPMLLNRHSAVRGRDDWDGPQRQYAMQSINSREFIYRPAFMFGRHIVGYEVQKVMAAVDWFAKDSERGGRRIGVIGWGEGGLIAFYSAALDTRIAVACVSGYFQPREALWTEPYERNIFGLLSEFGDAEIASLIAPRHLIIEHCQAPCGYPTPPLDAVQAEHGRAVQLIHGLHPKPTLALVDSSKGSTPFAAQETVQQFCDHLSLDALSVANGSLPERLVADFSAADRHARQMHQMDLHCRHLLRESEYVRERFLGRLDYSSVEAFDKSAEPYREHFRREIMGMFSRQPVSPKCRTRRIIEEPTWVGYEMQMNVYEGCTAYGYLLVPKNIAPGERRPVVFCQHGGGGTPDIVTRGSEATYKNFAAQLAERGFVVYAPSSMYDSTIVRMTNSIGKTQYSVIAAQYQQVIGFLKAQPFVDGDRIALYGLSWGGKTAMRLPILVPDFSLTICSGDFNDWIWKTTSTRSDHSYVFQPEPYIFEFNLGMTFNYAEMAALIAPRPFMVERGHDDPVAPDHAIGREFAKVRHLYEAKLNLPGRCRIEWFRGGHEINAQGTFEFLHEFLQ